MKPCKIGLPKILIDKIANSQVKLVGSLKRI